MQLSIVFLCIKYNLIIGELVLQFQEERDFKNVSDVSSDRWGVIEAFDR